jgi:hypothetical protein
VLERGLMDKASLEAALRPEALTAPQEFKPVPH